MRIFLDVENKIDYLDILLDKGDLEILPRRAIIKDYISIFDGKNSNKILNVVVRPEKMDSDSLESIKNKLDLHEYII